MRLLLIIAMLVASLSFTGVVKAADYCVDHDCQQEMVLGQDDAPANTADDSCHDCCLHSCGHVVLSGKLQSSPALTASQFRVVETPALHGQEPSGLLRPPRTA